MTDAPPFVLFDDFAAGQARLYERPERIVAAWSLDEVVPALDALRAGLAEGHHAAGYLAYEAGYALDPALAPVARLPDRGPLLWFGLFARPRRLSAEALGAWLGHPDRAIAGRPQPRVTRDAYLAAVETVRAHLLAGDIYQANLTFPNDVPVAGTPDALFARLRTAARARWAGLLVRENGDALLSLSPEQFFRLTDGVVEARPMKGTAPRRADPAADRAEAERLAADDKQRAENLMIVDLMRNDLARLSDTGTVAVPELFTVETYPTLHQLTSRITGQLRGGLDAVDVLRTIFPCGSVTGAPKIAAMEVIAALEPAPRGAYTGALGWIEPPSPGKPAGDAAFNVMIRTLEWPAGAEVAQLGLGSGLVIDARPADEWDECHLKGAFVTASAPRFDLIETMCFDPQEGIVAIEDHLERMRRSAVALGFAYDRHAARNELQAATFAHRHKARVRLLLSATGRMAIEVAPFEDFEEQPIEVAIRPLPVPANDFRLRHKTTDRHFHDDLRKEVGRAEVLYEDPEGRLTEGSRSTLYVPRDGRLATPPLGLGLMPSVLRQRLIDSGEAFEAELTRADLDQPFFVGNSLRGLVPARLADS